MKFCGGVKWKRGRSGSRYGPAAASGSVATLATTTAASGMTSRQIARALIGAYSIPSLRWICSSETPLVSGRSASTRTNCSTIITAKNAKAEAPERLGDDRERPAHGGGPEPVREAAQRLAAGAHAVREDLADVDPDHRPLREGEERDVADQAAEHEHAAHPGVERLGHEAQADREARPPR